MSNKHKCNNQIKQSQKETRIKRSNQCLLIVVLTSLDGGEGGGGMIPTGGWGPPPPFFYFWKLQSTSFLRQLGTYCLLYQLRLGAILKYVMMHE